MQHINNAILKIAQRLFTSYHLEDFLSTQDAHDIIRKLWQTIGRGWSLKKYYDSLHDMIFAEDVPSYVNTYSMSYFSHPITAILMRQFFENPYFDDNVINYILHVRADSFYELTEIDDGVRIHFYVLNPIMTTEPTGLHAILPDTSFIYGVDEHPWKTWASSIKHARLKSGYDGLARDISNIEIAGYVDGNGDKIYLSPRTGIKYDITMDWWASYLSALEELELETSPTPIITPNNIPQFIFVWTSHFRDSESQSEFNELIKHPIFFEQTASHRKYDKPELQISKNFLQLRYQTKSRYDHPASRNEALGTIMSESSLLFRNYKYVRYADSIPNHGTDLAFVIIGNTVAAANCPRRIFIADSIYILDYTHIPLYIIVGSQFYYAITNGKFRSFFSEEALDHYVNIHMNKGDLEYVFQRAIPSITSLNTLGIQVMDTLVKDDDPYISTYVSRDILYSWSRQMLLYHAFNFSGHFILPIVEGKLVNMNEQSNDEYSFIEDWHTTCALQDLHTIKTPRFSPDVYFGLANTQLYNMRAIKPPQLDLPPVCTIHVDNEALSFSTSTDGELYNPIWKFALHLNVT